MTRLHPGLPPPFEFIYDYEPPEPSSVDSLEGLLSWIDKIGCADQDRFKQARTPMWVFMQHGRCLGILATPFINEDYKQMAFELVRGVLFHPEYCTHYGFINEAWMASRANDDPSTLLPSEDPNRMDALMLSVHHRDGRQLGKTYLVDYDKRGTPSRRPYITLTAEDVAYGRAWDLFPRAMN